MTRANPAVPLLSAGLLLACFACSTDARPVADESPAPRSEHAPSAGPASTPPAGPSSPAGPQTPATTSGPLSRATFPTPRSLGRGWRYAVDPGDAEEGYLGNGTPALARDPDEVVLTAVPLGCARKATLPTPEHVLEVDYRFRGTSVIALRMRFGDDGAARTFHDNRRENLRACRGRSGGRAVGVLVRKVQELRPGALLSDRTPDSDPWTELAVLDGSDVVLMAAQARPGRPPLTTDRAEDIAARFRR